MPYLVLIIWVIPWFSRVCNLYYIPLNLLRARSIMCYISRPYWMRNTGPRMGGWWRREEGGKWTTCCPAGVRNVTGSFRRRNDARARDDDKERSRRGKEKTGRERVVVYGKQRFFDIMGAIGVAQVIIWYRLRDSADIIVRQNWWGNQRFPNLLILARCCVNHPPVTIHLPYTCTVIQITQLFLWSNWNIPSHWELQFRHHCNAVLCKWMGQ